MSRRTQTAQELRSKSGEGRGSHRRSTKAAGAAQAHGRRLVARAADDALRPDATVTVRLPREWMERALLLLPGVAGDPAAGRTAGTPHGIGMSAVIRLAIAEGLKALERRYRAKRDMPPT